MKRYQVEVRTDTVLVVETHSEIEAEKKALSLAWPLTGCCEGLHSSRVTKITNLSDPHRLVADLLSRLQWYAYDNEICRFCGGVPNKHAKNCVLGRAQHFLDEANYLYIRTRGCADKNRPKLHICPTCGTALGVEANSDENVDTESKPLKTHLRESNVSKVDG